MLTDASFPGERLSPPTPGEIAALYGSWGILDLLGLTLAELPPAWLEILNIARHLHDGHSLPGVDLPDELLDLLTPPSQQFKTEIHTEHRKRMVFPIADDTSVQPLRNILDFPQITLPDLLLRSVAPKLFNYLLISGGINGVYPTGSREAFEEYDEVVETLIPIEGPRRKKRQKVYALLDISNSMRDANKLLFAKALMLSYLITAGEERARIYFRTFGNRVHDRTDCLKREDFPELALRILRVTPDGSTDIERAIARVIDDIRDIDDLRRSDRLFDRPPTEILLVSDCESYSVPFIPDGIKLHTVHLKSGSMASGYHQGFERIRAASTTFTEVDTSHFRLPDPARDRWLLHQDGISLEPIEAAKGFNPESETTRTVRREQLGDLYERMGDASRQRGSRGSMVSGMHIKPNFGLLRFLRRSVEGLRSMADAVGYLFRRDRAAAPSHEALGVQFRQRR